jgi:pimeloyl-ACP methyl ester carboxylesterase
VEAIWYAASEDEHAKRPTLILGNGYDAAQEDSFHTFVVPALARGWNCLTYEGPGQPTVRRDQNISFIPDWERVVTPVVDYLLSEKANVVDQDRLALLGFSMGGYLAARAAAFEPRLSAVLLDGGVWDVSEAYVGQLSPELQALFNSGNKTAFDNVINSAREAGEFSTDIAWGIDQGLWSFHTHSPFDFLAQTKQYLLKDVVDKIQMLVWIADAEFEGFFAGQAQQVKDALGANATLHTFMGVAGYHCQVGATQELIRTMFAWLNKTLKL